MSIRKRTPFLKTRHLPLPEAVMIKTQMAGPVVWTVVAWAGALHGLAWQCGLGWDVTGAALGSQEPPGGAGGAPSVDKREMQVEVER